MWIQCGHWIHFDCIFNVHSHLSSMYPSVSIAFMLKTCWVHWKNGEYSKCIPNFGIHVEYILKSAADLIKNTLWRTFWMSSSCSRLDTLRLHHWVHWKCAHFFISGHIVIAFKMWPQCLLNVSDGHRMTHIRFTWLQTLEIQSKCAHWLHRQIHFQCIPLLISGYIEITCCLWSQCVHHVSSG